MGSVNPPSVDEAREISNVTYVVSGTGTPNDGKSADGMVLVDPNTGAPMEPEEITFTSLSISDGADAAEGSTTNSAGDPTVIGQLKQIVADLAGTLATSAADGSVATLGSTTDDAGDTTVIGRLQALILVLNTLIAQGARGTTAFNQVTVGTTPTLILAANPSRKSATIQNVTGGSTLVLGNDPNVVVATPGEGQYLGLVVAAGGDAEDTDSTSAWYGVVASGSADVRIVEVS